MSPSQRIDYELLTLVINCTKDWGYETRPIGPLQAIVAQAPNVNVSQAAIIERCKVLLSKHLLSLQKRDATGGFRNYAGEHEDDEFFYRGEFYLKRTPVSREYREELATLIEPEPPPYKRPIGF